jgi:hypothetical protein
MGPNIIKGEKINKMLIESKLEPTSAADPWILYLYAMGSPATKEKYLMSYLVLLLLYGCLIFEAP